jgi:hypothetical protein
MPNTTSEVPQGLPDQLADLGGGAAAMGARGKYRAAS